MAYYTTTESLLNDILISSNKNSNGDFPSWEGKFLYGAGTSFSSATPAIIGTSGAQKYAGIEEVVHIMPAALEYATTESYTSLADLSDSAVGGILQDISAAYLALTGGTTTYFQFRKVELEIFGPTSLGKYVPMYKLYINLWYS